MGLDDLKLNSIIRKENPYLSDFNWGKMWCAADNHNETCHTCAKGFSDSNFKWAINKI